MVQAATLSRSDMSSQSVMTGLWVPFPSAGMFPFAKVGSLTPGYGAGMHDLPRSRRRHAHGILNGIDHAESSLEVDPWIEQRHDGSARGNLEGGAARFSGGLQGIVRRVLRRRAISR